MQRFLAHWLDDFRWKEWGGMMATTVTGAFVGTLSMLGQLGIPPEAGKPWAIALACLAGLLFTAGYIRNPKSRAWIDAPTDSPAAPDAGTEKPGSPDATQ